MDVELLERSRNARAIMFDVKRLMLAYRQLELLEGPCSQKRLIPLFIV